MKHLSWLALALFLGLSTVAAPQFFSATDARAATAKPGVLDLNTATVDELTALPGIGAVKAKAIVDGRPYTSIDDFMSKGIVSKSVFDKFKDQVTVVAGKSAKATSTTAAANPPATTSATATGGKVNLNTATVDELNALPGIGAVTARAIVSGRPYASMDDFVAKGVVSKSAYGKFKDQVTVSAATAPKAAKTTAATTTQPAAAPGGKVDLNTATLDQLNALPGIGSAKSKAIMEGRPYASVDDFSSKGIVSKSVMDKIRDQVTVSGSASAKATTSTTAQQPATTADEANPPEPTGPIDLNTASSDELEALPGIGAVKAQAIVAGRPYASVADFESKGIVPKSTFDKFKDAIEVVPVAKAGTTTTTQSGTSTTATGTTTTGTQQGTPGQEAAHKRIRMCGAQWKAAKAANQIPAGQKWPQYWSACNTRLKQQGY